MRTGWLTIRFVIVCALTFAAPAFAAYNHAGETDSAHFLNVYPDKQGTKLDGCALCHTGGQYEKNGKMVSMGSCQWCHYTYGYDASGNIVDTLNPYGKDYLVNGRSDQAVTAIDPLDSDSDGFTNQAEIEAVRYPGNANDDPSKVPAPYHVYSLEELQTLPKHTQFQLMNTTKSGDYYAEYAGVTMEALLEDAGMLSSASSITVYAPDGWSQYHPLDPDPDPLFYHVIGSYPQADFYYDAEADVATSLDSGWCDYSAPGCNGLNNGDPIINPDGLKMILAYERDGTPLDPGVLNAQNKLDGEGPLRVVPPQKVPCPPDQHSNASNQDVIWPYDENADHNAGFSTRSVTIIRVDPLPEGTTDVDTLEAGWSYVDEGKILVYGAIDPIPTVKEKLGELSTTVQEIESSSFKRPIFRNILIRRLRHLGVLLNWGFDQRALSALQDDLLRHVDGCQAMGTVDGNDWIIACDSQTQVYWAINELITLLNIAVNEQAPEPALTEAGR